VCVSVCLCVGLSVCLCGYLCIIFTKFFMDVLMAVARALSGRVTKFQGEGASLGVYFPIDNALYSVAFGTHIKVAELIKMPFGMMSGLGPRNSVLHGGDSPRRGTGNFGGKRA